MGASGSTRSSKGMMSLLLNQLGSIALTTVWSLVSTVGGLQWQQGLLAFLVAFPGLAPRDQGKQWLGLEPLVYTHLAGGVSCRCFVVAGPVADLHMVMGPGQVARAGAYYGITGSYRGPDCQYTLLQMPTLMLSMPMRWGW